MCFTKLFNYILLIYFVHPAPPGMRRRSLLRARGAPRTPTSTHIFVILYPKKFFTKISQQLSSENRMNNTIDFIKFVYDLGSDREVLRKQHSKLDDDQFHKTFRAFGINTLPKQTCRFCGTPVVREDADVYVAYWWNFFYVCHKDCKVDGAKKEAYECQLIDCDCNDCRFFDRRPEGKNSMVGWCKQHNRRELAQGPMGGKPMLCFEHRRCV